MITILLWIAFVYLVIASFIFGLNLRDFTPLPKTARFSSVDMPPVSICIPARNEQATIARAIRSAMTQKYELLEVLVLDDQSTDHTPEILDNLEKKYLKKLKIIQGKPKPNSWLGKSWACHQLSKKARGQILFFIDADVWLEPASVQRVVQALHRYSLDFLTVWPMQRCETFWEKAVIPLIYYGLLSLLPARYVRQKPGWLPASMEQKVSTKFAAACGQCMVFRRAAYQQIGGHQSVKSEVVEDVALAKEVKREGLAMQMFHGRGTVGCRMYESAEAMWQGFRKNFLAFYGYSVVGFLVMALLNLIVFVLPVVTFISGIIAGNELNVILSASILILTLIHRLVLAGWYDFDKKMSFTQPLAVLWFEVLAVRVLTDYVGQGSPSWKGRSL